MRRRIEKKCRERGRGLEVRGALNGFRLNSLKIEEFCGIMKKYR